MFVGHADAVPSIIIDFEFFVDNVRRSTVNNIPMKHVRSIQSSFTEASCSLTLRCLRFESRYYAFLFLVIIKPTNGQIIRTVIDRIVDTKVVNSKNISKNILMKSPATMPSIM